MINISMQQAIADIRKGEKQYSEQQIKSATRMALNDGVRKGRTEVRRTIQSLYQIKTSRINDNDKRKGLSLKLATNSNLSSELDTGHKPVNLTDVKTQFKGTTVAMSFRYNKNKQVTGRKAIKRSTGMISVEVIKGQVKPINTAFAPGIVSNTGATRAIFARGKRGKPQFIFGKKRMPIAPLTTVSIATAAMATRSKDKYEAVVVEYAVQRLTHHLERLGNL